MKTRGWTVEQEAILCARFPNEPTKVVAQAVDHSYSATAAHAASLGIEKTAAYLLSPASGRLQKGTVVNGRAAWTAEQDAVLRERYPHELTAVVAAAVNHPESSTHKRAAVLGIQKTAEYLASSLACRLTGEQGRATRFTKGHTSHNKGKRRPGWSVGRMRETQFAKGQQSHNTKPIGFERVIDGYLWRKVSEIKNVVWTRNWRQVHLILWEEANGPIPKSSMIAFRNGNKADISLDNLECVSRADWMKRHTVHDLPPELKETVQLLGRVNRQIRKRERHAEEQDRRPA